MGRIQATFAQLRQLRQRGLIPFLTAGDPDLATSEALVHALVSAGADLIELGMPFSDPMADGPTIQAASERALAAGTRLVDVLALVRRVREHTNVPIVLMGYYNPILHYGPQKFVRDAAAAGVDGLLLVDLPPEEAGEIAGFLRQSGLCQITLLAPTTPPERAAHLAARAEGFLYYVSMTGVTGAQQVDAAAIEGAVRALRAQSPVPVAVGFGIATAADVAAVGAFADAVVVGSALVKLIASHGGEADLAERVGEFVRELKTGLHGAAA
jgi:tryptophan synthase alpha chain